MKQKLSSKILYYFLAIAASVFFLFPIYWVLITSFKSYKGAFAQPPAVFVIPDFANYISFFNQSTLLHYLKNSLIITVVAVVIPMFLGLFAAYALARSRIRGKESYGLFLLASRFIPPISTLIPVYLIFRVFNLYDTRSGLILINCAMNIPYVVWIMRGFINDIPVSIEESAMIDGCDRLQAFFRIIIPMCRSGIAATAVLIMSFTWNEFLYAMNLTSTQAKTLPLSMMTYMGEAGIEWNMMATAAIVLLLPTILFSILTHKNLGAGLTLGGVKE